MTEELQVNPSTRFDEVGRSGIYPLSGPRPSGDALVRGQGELGHPEERVRRSVRGSGWAGSAVLLAIGRAMFGGYFVYNGVNHFMNRKVLTEYARFMQVPAPGAAVMGSGVLLLLGGLSLVSGIRPKVGASLVSTFLLGVSPRMHAFWTIDDQQQRTQELVNFTKNMALVGGACLAAALPEPWPGSVRARGAR